MEKTKIFRQLLPLLFKTCTDSIFTIAEIWSRSSVSMLVAAALGSAVLISSLSPPLLFTNLFETKTLKHLKAMVSLFPVILLVAAL